MLSKHEQLFKAHHLDILTNLERFSNIDDYLSKTIFFCKCPDNF